MGEAEIIRSNSLRKQICGEGAEAGTDAGPSDSFKLPLPTTLKLPQEGQAPHVPTIPVVFAFGFFMI